jgi:butyryl-CoA dehydrogenase
MARPRGFLLPVSTVMFLSPTLDQFRSTLRDFCERELRPLVDQAEVAGCFPRSEILPAMAALGWFRIGVPEEVGGVGGSSRMHCLIGEEVARICGGFAVSVLPAVLGPAILMRLATPEQQAMLLEPMMRGERLGAIALTEPAAGSDLANLRTTARRHGDAYVLEGSKTFVTNGAIADSVIVAAILSELAGRKGWVRAAGINLFLVDRSTPGFSVARHLSKLGMRSSDTAELVFDACRIPLGNRLGGESANFLRLLDVLDRTRLYIAAVSVGLAQAAFEAACAYAKVRETFGKPIGQHQAVAFRLARMAVDLDAARLLIHRAADSYDLGGRVTKEVSMAKLFATEAATRITGDALQIHGGYGYTTEFPLERYFRDAKVGTLWEGTSEMQHLIIARELGFAV